MCPHLFFGRPLANQQQGDCQVLSKTKLGGPSALPEINVLRRSNRETTILCEVVVRRYESQCRVVRATCYLLMRNILSYSDSVTEPLSSCDFLALLAVQSLMVVVPLIAEGKYDVPVSNWWRVKKHRYSSSPIIHTSKSSSPCSTQPCEGLSSRRRKSAPKSRFRRALKALIFSRARRTPTSTASARRRG